MVSTENGNNGMVMPVAPMYGGGCNNGGFGFDNGNGAWWILQIRDEIEHLRKNR